MPVNPVTGSLNTTVKLIGEALVGSAWPAAWVTFAVGRVVSTVTVLSVLVDAALPWPALSWATPAPMVAVTVPSPTIPLTSTE